MKFFSRIMILIFYAGSVYGQQFYLKVQGGYGVGTSPRDFTSSYNSDFENSIIKTKTFSFGQGLNIGAALGYHINTNIACEIEIQYSKSDELLSKFNFGDVKASGSYYSTSFYINPSIILMKQYNLICPYLKLGPMIAFPDITDEFKLIHNYGENNLNQNNYYGGVEFGINSAIGIKLKAGQNLDLSFEISSKNISYSPTKRKLEKATSNGVNVLDSFTRSQKEIDFVDKITETDNYDPDKPGKLLKTEFPFSSLAFSVGISMIL